MPRGKRKAADPAGKDSNPRTPKKRKVTTQESKEESVENSINLLSDDIVRRIFFWMDLKELGKIRSLKKPFNSLCLLSKKLKSIKDTNYRGYF